MSVQSRTDVEITRLALSGDLKSIDDAIFSQVSAATAGYDVDTTSYPVATQATKTEKVTVDGGTEQTVTFTTAIDQGNVTDDTTYPVADQDTNTEKVTIDGGAEQTVTFAGVTTSNTSVATQMDAQLTGCSVAVVGGQVVITSDSTGASSAVAIGTGTCALSWTAPATVNNADGIAAEMNAQLTDCSVAVVGGQVKVLSDSTGVSSSIAIGTGTATLTWAAAVAGTLGEGVPTNTVVALNPATNKWVALTDVTASDGTEFPRGVFIGDAITGAAIAAGDIADQLVMVSGPGTVDEDLLNFQNSIVLSDEITNLNITVRSALTSIGIAPEKTLYVSQLENA